MAEERETSFLKGAVGTIVEKVDAFTTTGQKPQTVNSGAVTPRSNPNAAFAPRPAESRNNRVLEQVESAADYYGPDIYAQLHFYSNFSHIDDAISQDFIPVTQVKPNPKLFAVGLIPPASNITGRLLDRSGSVGAVVGAPEDIDLRGAGGGATATGGPGRIPNEDGTFGNASQRPGPNLPDAFWNDYVGMCNRLKVSPYAMAGVIDGESGFDPHAQNIQKGKVIAQGLNQFVRSTAVGTVKNGKVQGGYMTPEQWTTYQDLSAQEQLPFVERFMRGQNVAGKNALQIYARNFGNHNNPDGSMYAGKARQAAWLADHPGDKFNDPEGQQRAIDLNASLAGGMGYVEINDLEKYVRGKPSAAIRSKIDAAVARAGGGVPATKKVISPSENANGEWQTKGSANASKSKQEESKTFDNGLRDKQVALGEKFLTGQQAEINATIEAINTMKNTPPLRMLVNPSSFKVSSEKIIADGNWTRNGPIIEHWGDGQDKLEASGRVAGFFAIDANNPRDDAEGEGPGLTRVARNFSAAYHNFLSLWLLYRNNASIITEGDTRPRFDGTEWNRISMVGSIYIYYDNTMYIGSFDNFNITESDDKPYSLEYSFTFTVRATFLLDRPDTQSQVSKTDQQQAEQRFIQSANPTRSDSTSTGGGPVALPPGAQAELDAVVAGNAIPALGNPERNAVAEGNALPTLGGG
jgi:hypothetical protein